MILRVSVENLFSFKDTTDISFVAGKSNMHPHHVCRADKRDDISVLKAGIIYGANASGKSNVIKAVSVIRSIALGSVPRGVVEPFKLNNHAGEPSKVEIEVKIGPRYYAYGAQFSIKGMVEEWLYEINSRTDKEVFTRRVTSHGNEFTFGTIDGNDETKQLLRFIAHSTPATDSFLAEYVKRNGNGLEAISVVHKWMRDSLKIIFPHSRYSGLSVKAEKDDSYSLATKSLLEYFNTGIVDLRRVKVNKEDVELSRDTLTDLLSSAEPGNNIVIATPSNSNVYFIETDGNGISTIYRQTALHRTASDREVPFEMSEESDGSIRLLDFIPMLIDLRLNSAVYLIDEIDRSMHPMLSHKLLEYYFSCLSSDRDTQLICTTHESNLLNLDLLRADEVWFVEKGNDGSSHLVSLAEYKPRQDVRKGYLQGRYGAIPFFAPINELKW